MDAFKSFIENNRQLGSTTELVKAALGVDGYVVVSKLAVKKIILERHPTLREDRVLTKGQFFNGTYPNDKRPVFIDVTAVL